MLDYHHTYIVRRSSPLVVWGKYGEMILMELPHLNDINVKLYNITKNLRKSTVILEMAGYKCF
jgi:hypothetical protein